MAPAPESERAVPTCLLQGRLVIDGAIGRCVVDFAPDEARVFLPGLHSLWCLLSQRKGARALAKALTSGPARSLTRLLPPFLVVLYHRRVARAWWDDQGELHWRLTRWRKET